MQRKITSILTIILLLFAAAPGILMAVDRTDYDSGLEKYKQKQNKAALAFFQRFILQFPKSVKADDAQWYMGRIYIRLNLESKAEMVLREVLLNKNSNRFEEASYDLGKILYSRKQYSEVVDLLRFIDTTDELNSYHLKGLELSARAWYRLAFREKLDFNEEASAEMFLESLNRYKRLEPIITDKTVSSRVYFAMGEIYSHLSDITYNSVQYTAYQDKALKYLTSSLPMISDFYREKAEKMVTDLELSRKVRVTGRLRAFGGADNLSAGTYGSDIYAKSTLLIPASTRNIFSLDLSYKHDSFDFVASNFDPLKTGDERLVQYSDTFGIDLAWKKGTRRTVYNKLNVSTDYQIAEDIRDNYLGAGVSDSGSYRLNYLWRFGWDSSVEWRTYPNYLVSGRKLDYVSGTLDPSIKYYGLEWANISLIYGLELKQYLDSKYDTINPAVASAKDKRYLYNSGELVFDFQFNKIYKPSISYKVKYLKTYDYDYWVSGSPADRFVEGYYDYVSHSVTFDNNLKFSDKFKVSLGSEFIFTDFINYPARDASKTFIDKIRSDTAVKLDIGANYLFWTTPGGTELEGRLSGWWDYKTSNMTYNTTFVTNYSFGGIMLGMSARMP